MSTKQTVEETVELLPSNIGEYFTNLMVHINSVIEKNGGKWDSFDYTSAINFILKDIEEDIKKLSEYSYNLGKKNVLKCKHCKTYPGCTRISCSDVEHTICTCSYNHLTNNNEQ